MSLRLVLETRMVGHAVMKAVYELGFWISVLFLSVVLAEYWSGLPLAAGVAVAGRCVAATLQSQSALKWAEGQIDREEPP